MLRQVFYDGLGKIQKIIIMIISVIYIFLKILHLGEILHANSWFK